MTLIAVFTINGIPIMISDILLSSDAEWGLPVKEIPIIGKLPFFVGKNLDKEFTWLVQKTILMNNNCVVGWAGNLRETLVLIEDLEDNFKEDWDFTDIYGWFKGVIERYKQNKAPSKPKFHIIHNENQKYRLVSCSIPVQT